MKKLLASLLCASLLIACSTDQQPKLVFNNCHEARDLVYSNHQRIEHAFANNDTNAVGRLELQDHNIFMAAPECFNAGDKVVYDNK